MSIIEQEQTVFDSPENEIAFLRLHIDKLEGNREKLIASIMIKKEKDDLHNIHLSEESLSNFFHLDRCDQKLLAILYWDKLTQGQKEVFTDWEEMEFEKQFEGKMHDIMTNPTKMREHFLKGASPILESMIDMAVGNKKLSTESTFAFKEVWEVLKGVINSANAKAPILDLRKKDVSQQIDEILTSLTAGKLTFDEAKEFMSLVSQGFNIQELPKLMKTLERLENG